MAPDKLAPNDSRVVHHSAVVHGKTYHNVVATPAGGSPSATVLLVHGFPDIGFGWRYQVPALLSLNLRVLVPDMLGYGRTDAPEPLAAYSLKSVAADMAALVAHVLGTGQQVILGGHDWGGFLVWRIALWYPELVRAVFSVCTPYSPPRPDWIPDDQYVKLLPNFGYQLQFAGPDVETNIVGKDKLRQFFNGLFGGKGPNGEVAMSTATGILFENLDKLRPSSLVSSEELDFYVDEFDRHGLRGPLNWYRTRKINYEEEQALVKTDRIRLGMPSMVIMASRDAALPPAMAKSMDQYFDQLVYKEVDAGHWALWHTPDEVNIYIREFVLDVLGRGPSKSLL